MNLFGKVTRASLYLVTAFGTAFAQAAENMPGGPALYQLNFPAPATKMPKMRSQANTSSGDYRVI